MEYDARFYYSKEELDKIIDRLNNISELHSNLRIYEKVIEYDNRNKKYHLDNNEHLRIRISHNELINKCKLSWKKEVTNKLGIKSIEEKKVKINYVDVDNLIYILDKVMHFKVSMCYERYRIIYENNDIEISVDEYPFGICLKEENKSIDRLPTDVINEWIDKLGLNRNDLENLNALDEYYKLCQEQKIKYYKEITFDKPMPKINNKLK